MKKITIMMAMSAILLLAACSGNEEQNNASNAATSDEETSQTENSSEDEKAESADSEEDTAAEETTAKEEEPKEESNADMSWEDKINELASNDSSASEKFTDLEKYMMNYEASEDEVKQFEQDIIDSYESGNYLSELENHEMMLTNMFKAGVVEGFYNDDEQLAMDSFAFDYYQNLKYTYRGVDAVDSESVKSNESQMDKALAAMK